MKIILGACVTLAGVVALAPPTRAAEHPTLVDVASAQCDLCHDELLEGKTTIHAPVSDDCTTCHEFSKDEEGTQVELMETEPALCVICHDEMEKAVELELETPHFPVGDSCLTCHDAHASKNARLLLAATTQLCAECHDLDDLDAVHDGQLTESTTCTSCHVPHGSDNNRMLLSSKQHAPFADGSCSGCHREPFGDRVRLRARGQRLCIACHGEFPEHEAGSKHGALEDQRGRAGCLSCHNPHMSEHSTLLVEGGNALCAECHADILQAAEAETGHYPAADDCTMCHQPHTSEEPTLLATARDDLCADCHDLEDDDLIATHLGAKLDGSACLGCHSPHGAGNPSALAQHMHFPIEDGCDTCHDGAFDQFLDDEPALCLMCHEDIAEHAAEAAVPHDAMEMESCVLCHNPHASAQEKLVKAPGAGPCADCHEQAAGPDEVSHGIIDLVGCRACHEPHGGENEKLLRRTGSDLCLACHREGAVEIDAQAQRATFDGRFSIPVATGFRPPSIRLSQNGTEGHPLINHRTLGTPSADELENGDTTFAGEMTCLTCHDPHKGSSRHLFREGARSPMEACNACHDK